MGLIWSRVFRRCQRHVAPYLKESNWISLPDELLLHEIFPHLSVPDLISCLGTCKRFHSIISSSSRFLYHMELEKAGMIDNPYLHDNEYTYNKRLHMLLEREWRWESFQIKWKRRLAMPYDGLSRPLFSFTREGRLIRFCGKLMRLYIASEPVAPANRISWKESPSLPDLADNASHLHGKIASHELDLLVFPVCASRTSIMVHLIQLSSGKAHPSARAQVLKVGSSQNTLSDPAVDLALFGDHLACLTGVTTGLQSLLTVWNWKHGHLKGVARVPQTNIVFLGEDLLLVPNCNKPSLDLYHTPLSTSDDWDRDERVSLRPITSLLLPELIDNARLINIICNSANQSPERFWPDRIFSSRDFSKFQSPFQIDPQTAILPFSLLFEDAAQDFVVIEILARAEVFLHTAKSAFLNVECYEETANTIPWNDWGPASTRWFMCSFQLPSFGIRSVSGSRCVAAWQRFPTPDLPFTFYDIEILDFGRWRVRKYHAGLKGISSNDNANINVQSSLENEVSLMAIPNVFRHPVMSRLPYIRRKVSSTTYKTGESIDISHAGDISIYQTMIITNFAFDNFDVMFLG